MLRIGWYTTRGRSSRAMFEAVLEAARAGDLDAEIAFVFSNREAGEDPATDSFLELVRGEGIPLLTLSSVAFRRAHAGARSRPGEPLPAWREAFDAEVARLVDAHRADLGVLAGYMLIFTPPFVEAHPAVNLHPALPGGPTGTWAEVIRALIRSEARESGVMLNVAIPEVDMGPVAAFCRYAIVGEGFDAARDALRRQQAREGALDDDALDATPLFARVRAAQVAHEAPFLVAALQAFAEGRVRVRDGTLEVAADTLPLDLTGEVTGRVRTGGVV